MSSMVFFGKKKLFTFLSDYFYELFEHSVFYFVYLLKQTDVLGC